MPKPVLEHEILKTLKEIALKVSWTGSEDKKRIPIDKLDLKTTNIHYGVLVDILNNPNKIRKYKLDNFVLKDVKVGKDEVEITKYQWKDVSTALDILYLNGDIGELGDFDAIKFDSSDRIIYLSSQGLKSFLTNKYIEQRKEEIYKRDLRWFTKFSFLATFFTLVFAGTGALYSILQYKKNDPIKVEELNKLTQQIKLLRTDTLISKVLLHPNQKVVPLPK